MLCDKMFRKEIHVWSKLLHQNVLPLLGFTYRLLPNLKLASLVSPWMPLGSARQYLEYRSAEERTRMVRYHRFQIDVMHINIFID